MRPQLLKINQAFERLPDWVGRHRALLWGLFASITILAFFGMQRFRIDNSWNALFQPDEPVKVAYDRFRAVFGSDEVLYLVYEARDGDVFSERSLGALHKLHTELEERTQNASDERNKEFSHITDITSLINVSFLEGSRDVLISRDFVGEALPKSPSESDSIRKEALNHPDYPLLLCSEDSRFGGIIIRTDFNAEIEQDEEEETSLDAPKSDFDFAVGALDTYQSPLDGTLPRFKTTWLQDYVPFMDLAYEIIAKPEYADHLKFYPAGTAELMGFLGREIEKEMLLIIVGSLALILVALGLLFRSLSAVLWPLVIVLLTVLWTLGTIGWVGVSMTDFINIIVFLLIAVGIADTVHILSGYLFFRRQGEEPDTAIRSVYKKSGFACFLTSITTAAGFLALSFAPIVAVQRLAVFASCGVFYAFLITVFMLPLLLNIMKPKVKEAAGTASASESGVQRLLGRLESLGTKKPILTLVIFALIGLALIPGIRRIQIDSNQLTIIRENRPIRANFDVVDDHMAGTGNIEILVDTGVADGLKDPIVLQSMGTLQRRLEEEHSDTVYKTVSLVNMARNSYRVLNEGRQEMYIIPDDPDELAQTLFLFGTANPKDRRLLVTDDYRAARITVSTRNIGSQEGLAFMKVVNSLVDEHFGAVKARYPDSRVESTGQIPMFLRMMDLISWSQIQSFGICLLVISAIMLLVLRDLRIGIIAMVPNLFPILTVFGLMGWLNIPLDVHTLLVVPIIIGISVDDTIHFITHYTLEMKKHRNIFTSIRLAIREAGQAILFTSIVLAIGYLVFLICVNKGFAYFGFLSSVAMIAALFADLVLLPALLCCGDRAKRANPKIQEPS